MPRYAAIENIVAGEHAPVALEIVPGATHLFEEPGTLEQVALLAADWCRQHLDARAAGG